MKRHTFFILFLFCLPACICTDDSINMDMVNRLVYLNSGNLLHFMQLSDALIQDLPKIRKQNGIVRNSNDKSYWLTTNSYYLDQIDSARYRALLMPLKGKYLDQFGITESGETQIVLKQYTQQRCGTYNNTYTHLLVSNTGHIPAHLIFGDLQTIYTDSVVNQDWRYQYFFSHSGH